MMYAVSLAIARPQVDDEPLTPEESEALDGAEETNKCWPNLVDDFPLSKDGA